MNWGRNLRLALGGILFASLLTPPVLADSDFGDFQRNVEHDRAFQREMDAQRSATDAINKGSTFKAPPSQAVSAQAWLNALDEKKHRETEANLARGREYDLRALRQHEAWLKTQKTDAQRYREAMEQVTPQDIARYQQSRAMAEGGISGWDQPLLAEKLYPQLNGTYAGISTPELRAAIAVVLKANEEYRRLRDTADYATLDRLVRVLEFGPSGHPGDPTALLPYFAAHTAFSARKALFERFKTAEAASELRQLCEAWPAWVPIRKIAFVSQNEIVAVWSQAAIVSGGGESEFLAQSRYRKSARYQILIDDREYVIAVAEAYFNRERPALEAPLPRQERIVRSQALFDALLYLGETYSQNQLPKVFESYLRAFELPQMVPTVTGQAGLVQRLERYPGALSEVSPAQWKRFAAVRGLAVPTLLKELPSKIDPAREPALNRILRLNLAAQSDDALTALQIAYDCLGRGGVGIDDPAGLGQALTIATADVTRASTAQQVAAFRARALSAYLRGSLSPGERLVATAAGHAAGVAESSYIFASATARVRDNAEARADARRILLGLIGQPLWENRLSEVSPAAQVGLVWLQETEDAARVQKAEAVWREGAGRGDKVCAAELGYLLTNNTSPPASWAEGRQWLKEAADAGQPLAAGRIGFCLFMGARGYPKDPGAAVPLLRLGLKSRGRDACAYCLGHAYARGLGVDKNMADAIRWWEAAKDIYADPATIEIATVYAEGDGVQQDFPHAIALLLPVAEKENASAQVAVGTWISRGKDPSHAVSESTGWWRRAAAHGNFIAARNLYTVELRRSQDAPVVTQAVLDLETFLEQQSPETQYAGGLLLLNQGRMGFKENIVNRARARVWIERAAARDYEPARTWLKAAPTDVRNDPVRRDPANNET
ncbi:MAG: tetratricopeptide repeat protein [Opitutaceae bacterium]